MSDVKNAVVVGKVTLARRKEVVVKVTRQVARPETKQSRPAPRREVEEKFESNPNGQMLSELQYVKKQLREKSDTITGLTNSILLERALYVELITLLESIGTAQPLTVMEEEQIHHLKAKLGLDK